LDVLGEESIGVCQYCGTKQTLPSALDEQKANLFNRANHFRMHAEYDKAMDAYDGILNMDAGDAKAHWGLVLSRYGIEYVEDPQSKERIPTLHRIQPASILTDPDYLAAAELAPDTGSKALYEEEAARIAEIQKGVLSVAAQEEPYDVFICYKDTEEDGTRTKDSTLAQDIYYQLQKDGHRVFFSRISLEDKLGREYEPYIFAALHSARVMLAVGTTPEHFAATWVKNEWSRFLSLMKQDTAKTLIPCYRDLDPYDLPEQLSMLQSLDMGKIGFMQDLSHGVEKVLRGQQDAAPNPQAAPPAAASAAAPLVKRARLMCEDGDWKKATELVEEALNLDPENGETYLVALMAECGCPQEENLGMLVSNTLDERSNYKKARRFGDDALQARLVEYDAKCKALYDRGEKMMKKAEAILNGEVFDEKTEEEKRRQEQSRLEQEKQVQNLQTELSNLAEQERKLTSHLNSLGFFAKEKKRQTEAQLKELQEQKRSLVARLQALERDMPKEQPKPHRHKWRALRSDAAHNRVAAITCDIVEQMSYHEGGGNVTWETCTLRRWLNGSFYDSLPADMRAHVAKVPVNNPKNAQHGTTGGNDTEDKVFLLSIDAARALFKDDEDRVAMFGGKASWWWLRSPGYRSDNAAIVNNGGSVRDNGLVHNFAGGVRPALWLNLES
jgi:hypothetical protein